MSDEFHASDSALLDLLRHRASMTVSDMSEALQVTATAVRQRLGRLLALGYIERTATKAGRGRPSHQYSITGQGRRQAGVNFADLAVVLWGEVRAIKDPTVRDEILKSISSRLASMYAEHVEGVSVSERMEAVASMFRQRDIPFEVDHSDGLPVLKALACPYVDLADDDRSICRMERMLFSEMVGATVQSTLCRLDGDLCCAFVAN